MSSYCSASDALAAVRWVAGGSVQRFEREFSTFSGMRHALGTSYGRTALYLGLRAVGVEGGEVLLPAFICTVVRHAVVAAGATPRFVDVDPETFEMDLDDLRRKIVSGSRAIVLVHFFGQVARNLGEVARIAREYGLVLAEDCAHALGARERGRPVGASGDFSVFSLTKNTLNCGGGVLATDDERIARRAREILTASRVKGRERVADFPVVIAYGLEQAVAKLDHDRVRRHRRWLDRLPALVRGLRKSTLRGVKTVRQGSSPTAGAGRLGRSQAGPWLYHLPMEPIIASIGRSQLRKVEALNRRRERIAGQLGACDGRPGGGEALGTHDVFGILVFRARGGSVGETVRRASERGLGLRSTWPTRQKLWEGQETPAVRRIAAEVCIWNVNPDLGEREIERARGILADVGATRQRFPAAEANSS